MEGDVGCAQTLRRDDFYGVAEAASRRQLAHHGCRRDDHALVVAGHLRGDVVEHAVAAVVYLHDERGALAGVEAAVLPALHETHVLYAEAAPVGRCAPAVLPVGIAVIYAVVTVGIVARGVAVFIGFFFAAVQVGPDGGTAGGEIVFAGTPKEMTDRGSTITSEYLRKSL